MVPLGMRAVQIWGRICVDVVTASGPSAAGDEPAAPVTAGGRAGYEEGNVTSCSGPH